MLEVILVIDNGAVSLVKHALEREATGGIFFERQIPLHNEVWVEAIIHDPKLKAFVKNNAVRLKGLKAIYVRNTEDLEDGKSICGS